MTSKQRMSAGSVLSSSPIDLVHLQQQTLGDRVLEAELLDLFSRQARRIVSDLAMLQAGSIENGPMRADLLHTLCGSARAIGAWEVAAGAEHLERASRAIGSADPLPVVELERAVTRVCATIASVQAVPGAEERPGSRR